MRAFLLSLAFVSRAGWGQIPESGVFRYEGKLWRVTSTMDVDTEVFFLKVKLRDLNNFTHDGTGFQSFDVEYFKDVPLQKTIRQTMAARRLGETWSITGERNLVSRLILPDAILRAGESRSTRSLDPLTLDIGPVESKGLGEESITFQGKARRLHVMEQKAPDGDVKVKKFDNGLIYHSQTAEGYALLKSAQTPDF